MKIAGDKVILRAIEEQDRELLFNLIRTSESGTAAGGYPVPKSYGHQMNWFRSAKDCTDGLRCIIADRERPEAGLGIILLSNMDFHNGEAEVYIKLMKSARGKGYGEDAINALVSYGFLELRLKHIYSNVLERNLASQKLFEKCGFKMEGVHRSKAHKDGHYENVCVYGIFCTPPHQNGQRELANEQMRVVK